ncbi:MAG: oligosaccharide flippase family protein [Thermodesulfovibrionales bacterium]
MQENKPQSSLLSSLRLRPDSLSLEGAGTHLRELLRGGSAAFVLRVAGMAAGYAFTLMVTRAFGAYAMGVFALSATVLSVLAMVGKAGLDTALLRFVADYSSQGRRDLAGDAYLKSLSFMVPWCLFLTAALFFLSPYLSAHVFKKAYMASYFRIASLAVLPAALVALNSQCLRGLKKVAEFAFLQNVAVFLVAALVLFPLLLFSRGAGAPVAAYVAATAVVAALSFLMWRNSGSLGRAVRGGGMRLSEILGVSFPMFFASSMYLVMHWTDILMLGAMRPESEVGVYNVAVKVATVTSITLFAVNSIAAPKFAESYGKGDTEGLRGTVAASTGLIFWTSLPILIVLVAFPSFVMGIFGDEFRAGRGALLLLVGGQFVNAISGSVGFLLNMTGRQRALQNILLAAAVINIGLNALLIPSYGMNGAALASMVSMAFWNLAAVAYIKARYDILTLYFPGLRWLAR